MQKLQLLLHQLNRKAYEKEYVCICVDESLCCTPETNTSIVN